MRLIDSDIIIWNWRSQEAAATLLAAEPFAISAVRGLNRLRST